MTHDAADGHRAGAGPHHRDAATPPHDPADGTDLTGHVAPASGRPGWLDPRRVGLASLLSFLIIVGVLIRNRGRQDSGTSATASASRIPPTNSLPVGASIPASELAKARRAAEAAKDNAGAEVASPAVRPDLLASNDGPTPPTPDPASAGLVPEPAPPSPGESPPPEPRAEAAQPPPTDFAAPSAPVGPDDPPPDPSAGLPAATPEASTTLPTSPITPEPTPSAGGLPSMDAPPVTPEPARPDGRTPAPEPAPERATSPTPPTPEPARVATPPTFAPPPAPAPTPVSPTPSPTIEAPDAPIELKAGGGKIPNAGRRTVLAEGGMATGLSAARDGAPAGVDPVGPSRHVVEPGENFWTIARLHYGSGRYYKALWEANKAQCRRPEDLAVGDAILVPPPELLDRALIASADASPPSPGPPRSSDPSARRTASRSGASAQADEVAALPVTSARTSRRPRMTRVADDADSPRYVPYKVRSHETLRSIARDALGDSHRDAEIRQLNLRLLGDTGQPVAGQILKLPGDDR